MAGEIDALTGKQLGLPTVTTTSPATRLRLRGAGVPTMGVSEVARALLSYAEQNAQAAQALRRLVAGP